MFRLIDVDAKAKLPLLQTVKYFYSYDEPRANS